MIKRIANDPGMAFFLLVALLFAGCADREKELLVPIRISAENRIISADSRGTGVVSPGTAFTSTFIAAEKEDFITTAWRDDVSVTKDAVSFSTGHHYPPYGDWIYLTGVHPALSSEPQNGRVSFTLDGTTDIMYAAPHRGNKWDSNRFAGNTVSRYDEEKKFVFTHLLTQLQIKAKKAEANGLPFTIQGITIKNITRQLTLSLANGEHEFANTPSDLVIPQEKISQTAVTGTDEVSVAQLLLPPAPQGSFTFDIKTSAGTFSNVAINLDDKNTGEGKKGFRAGYAHRIVLTIHDKNLGITVNIVPWKDAESGNMDLVD